MKPLASRRVPIYAGIGAAAILIPGTLLFVGGQALGAGPLAPIRATPTKTGAEIRVQIDGAVEKPGVYRLTASDRVEDLVKAAGGLSRSADQSKVNLAQRLSDAQRITIPFIPTPTPAPTFTPTRTPTTAPATPTVASTASPAATPTAAPTAAPTGTPA